MSEKKVKEQRKAEIVELDKEFTPQQAKAIIQKAREKDAQDCLNAINQAISEALGKYRCVMFGKITLAQAGSVIEITGSGKNFDYGIIALKE